MARRSNPLIAAILGVVLLGCPTKDPQASDPNCPGDAPCFISVVAPRGQTAAPGPFSIVAEVIGPHRIEGVGLVLSVNGAASQDLRLARLTSSRGLWGIPDLETTDTDPPEAHQSAQAMARLQPGDEVTFLLWAWDQMGQQTQWVAPNANDTGAASFRVVDALQGSRLPGADTGMVSDAGSPGDATLSGDAALPPGDAGASSDASVGPLLDATTIGVDAG